MADGKRDPDRDSPPEESRARSLFDDLTRAIGRTAGRTKSALARLGERGAIAVTVRRLEHQRSGKLRELGQVARDALSAPDGLLRRDDPRVQEIVQALDRLDEKLARMRERLEEFGGGAPPGGEAEDADPDPGDGAEAAGPREE